MTIGRILGTIGVALLLVPLAVFVTILIRPFWSWIEATFYIESIGHSGPAEWCYLATYIVCIGLVMAFRVIRSRGKESSGRPTDDELL